MKQDLKNDLLRDELLRAVAKKKMKIRAGKVVAVIVPALLAIALMYSGEEEPIIGQVAETAEVKVAEPAYTVLESEEDLLDHLAELGPVLITRSDGSKVLYLTEH